MEIDENRERPSVFNTAQILHGLTRWHAATRDGATLLSAQRAAEWLLESQDADGAWRGHLYGSGSTYTYMAHAACWLAEFGEHAGDERLLNAARRHLEWVLTHVDESTGWIDECGFGDEDQRARRAVTHTIAYTIWGILLLSRILGHAPGMSVARRAALAVARRLELSRWLPGKLDAEWKSAAKYACLTGNAQMALVWFELHRLDADPALVSSACKAIGLVERAQNMTSSDPGIRGGIGGSDPIWGGYVSLAIPNWAAKFYIDALLEKEAALRGLEPGPVAANAPAPVPLIFDAHATTRQAPSSRPPRIVLLAKEEGTRVAEFCEAWAEWNFKPHAVLLLRESEHPLSGRLRDYIREHGVASLARRAIGGNARPDIHMPEHASSPRPPAAAYCAAKGLPTVVVDSLTQPDDLARIRALEPDLFIYSGAGILRRELLAIPRLGTLNAHMGLLPTMRGMNVAEWSVMYGVPVGCTVHLVDEGIDTGDILASTTVSVDDMRSVAQLRERVDAAQIELLGTVVASIRDRGVLPQRCTQAADAGRQFFVMHPDVHAVLQRRLARGLRRQQSVMSTVPEMPTTA